MNNFWYWSKKEGIRYDGHDCLVIDRCVNFKRSIWFELEECMWRNHWRIYQEHLRYVCNDIVKPFRVIILPYVEIVR